MNIKSKADRAWDAVFIIIGVFVGVICLVPMIHLLAKSLSDSSAVIHGDVGLWPVGFNIDAYKDVLSDSKYVWSFWFTVILTIICTVVSLTMTTLCAYPLIFENLKGRKLLNLLITITMFFNAGQIPNYVLMQKLNLLSNPVVLVIPSCLSVFNMIILRSFYYGIPDSLRESAEIDGASFVTILTKIYIPLSKPVYATLALFYAVGRWNGYSDSLIYMRKEKFYPLQHLLYNVVSANSSKVEAAINEGFSTPGANETLKAAIVMFSTIPILCIYPWLQRYFIHGVTLGAVKE